jgi:hypothetical protein
VKKHDRAKTEWFGLTISRFPGLVTLRSPLMGVMFHLFGVVYEGLGARQARG